MTKTQAISAQILAAMAFGLTVQEALNKVCGAGTFEKLASDLHDELLGQCGEDYQRQEIEDGKWSIQEKAD